MIGILTLVLVAGLMLAMMLHLNTAYIPAQQDSSLQMENAITKTATFAGTTKDLGSGYAPGGVGAAIGAVVQITAIDAVSGDETYTAQLFESDDDSTYTQAGPIITISRAAGAQTLTVPGFVSKRYLQLK